MEEGFIVGIVGALRISIRVRLLLASGLVGLARFGVAIRVSPEDEGPVLVVGLMSDAMLFWRP